MAFDRAQIASSLQFLSGSFISKRFLDYFYSQQSIFSFIKAQFVSKQTLKLRDWISAGEK